jgi:hypothetical protein
MQQNTQLLNQTFISYSGRQVANLMMGLMGAIVDSIVISRFLGVSPSRRSNSYYLSRWWASC